MLIRTALLIASALLLAFATPAVAWKGDLAAAVLPVATVNENAESGDLVAVQGHIADISTGSGSRYIVTLKDDTGSVLVRVPEHLLRHVAGGRSPEIGAHVRVGGKWTHGYLDRDVWGIHAQAAERVQD